MKFRRNTAAGAAANNTILAAGEPGYETDSKTFKIGDGVTAWNTLPLAMSGTYAQIKEGPLVVTRYGAKGDGTTDDTAAFQAAIQACYNANGGAIYVPKPTGNGKYRINGQLTFPDNNDAQLATGKSVRIFGDGYSTVPNPSRNTGSTTLDLRYSGSVGKIYTKSQMVLEIDHLVLEENGATTTTPFIYTTLGTVNLHDLTILGHSSKINATCDQDAIILGGNTAQYDNTPTSGFGGYGSVVERVAFNNLRRCVWFRTWSVTSVHRCIVGQSCGAPSGSYAAFDLDRSGAGWCTSNTLTENYIEQYGYVYAIAIRDHAQLNYVGFNSFWDSTGSTIASVYLDSTASNNTIFMGLDDSVGVLDQSTAGSNFILDKGVIQSYTKVQGRLPNAAQLTVQGAPSQAVAYQQWTNSSGAALVSVKNPAVGTGAFLEFATTGTSGIGDANGPWLAYASGAGYFFSDVTTGDLVYRANTGQSLRLGAVGSAGSSLVVGASAVTANKPIGTAAYATGSRPTVTAAGTQIFDSTLGKPIWWNGSVWKDAAGTTV